VPDLAAALNLAVTGLHSAGVETASTDPADILAPGVLVQLVDFSKDTLGGGWAYNLNLILVAADVDGGPGPAAALSTLLNLVLAWAQPDGPIQSRSIQLPSGPAPLPGLVFPLTVRTDV
jgi:hypothetical protein